MTVRRQKIQIDVEATTEGAVRGMDRVAAATDKARKAVEKDNEALKKAKLEYEVAQARAKNLADTQAKATKRMADFAAATDRSREAMKRASVEAESKSGILARMGKRLNVDVVGGLMAVSSAINIGRSAWDIVSQGAQAVSELAERSVAVNNVMGNLPFSLDKARMATSGLVKDLDLATAASTLVSTGVVDNAEEFANLARAAQALGGRIGIDTKQAMESLTAALARGSTEMLDNLGIVLKTEQAHEIYAAQLGKTTSALTNTEKAEAFRKVAMDKIIEAARGIKVDTDSAGAAVKRFEADLDRLQNKALGGAESQVTLRKGLESVAMSTSATAKDIAAYGRDADALRSQLRDLNVNTNDLTISNAALGKELDKVRKQELSRVERLIFQGEATEENIRQLEFLRRALGDAGMVGATAVDAAIERQKEEALAARQARQAMEEEHQNLQTSIAFLQGKGDDQKLINAAVMEEMELRAKLLDAEGKSAEASKLRADKALMQARMEGEALRRKSRGARGRKSRRGDDMEKLADATALAQWERTNALMVARNQARWEQAQELNPFSEQNLARQLENVIDFEERRAAVVLAQRQREIETMRAAGADPVQLAEAEAEAQLQMLAAHEAALDRRYQREIDLAVLQGEEFTASQLRVERELALVETQDQAEAQHHAVAMARLEERRAAEEAVHERRVAIAQESLDLALGAAGAIVQGAVIEGKALKGVIAATAKSEAMRHGLILGPSAQIQALFHFATGNVPQGVALQIAAAKHFAFAGAMGALGAATGAFGRSRGPEGGFGAEAFGAGAGTGGLGGRSAGPGGGGFDIGGQVPLSQETRQRVSASASMGSGGGGVAVQQSITIHATGQMDDMTIRKIAQGLERTGQRQGKLAAGGMRF